MYPYVCVYVLVREQQCGLRVLEELQVQEARDIKHITNKGRHAPCKCSVFDLLTTLCPSHKRGLPIFLESHLEANSRTQCQKH